MILPYIPSMASLTAMSTASATENEVADSLYNTLNEVDVVAVKFDSGFRNSSVTGTQLKEAQVENLGIRDIKHMSSVVPNFHIPDYGSRITSTIYVRGIGARMDQAGVGLSVDNVNFLNKDSYDFDIPDIASMEMLRGPQSTLFGRNTMTGMINVRTISPMEYQGWRGGVTIGMNNLFRFNLGWYGKVNEKFGMSFVGAFNRYGGEFRNVYCNEPVDREISGSTRLKIAWRPSRHVTINNTLSSSILRQGGYAYENVASGQINYNDTCFYRRFLINDGLSVDVRFPNDMRLTSITNVQHIDDNMTLDQDFLPESYFTLTQKKRETSISEDLMLKGKNISGNYSWMCGLYGFYRHLDMTAPVTFKDYGIARLIEDHRNDANPKFPIYWDDRQFPLNSDFKLPSAGAAIYHESRYRLKSWEFAVGLRLDYEHTRMKYHSFCNTAYTIYRNTSGVLPFTPDSSDVYEKINVNLDETGILSKDYLMFVPKVSVMYEFEDFNLSNVYLSIGKGYKAGGYNTQMFSDVLQQKLMQFMGLGGKYDVNDIVSYKPEKLWNFEIGTHLNLLNSKMQVDASLFYIDCRDQQLTKFPEGQMTGRMMTNAGHTRSFGGEIGFQYEPLKHMMLYATYGYTNARFLKYDDGKADYKGKRLPYAPSNTLFAEASYDIQCSTSGKYFIGCAVNFNGVGDIYWNEANSLKQKFYGLLGASIRYTSPRWSVELWGKNLTNTKYYTFYFLSMGNEFRQKGHKITLGATLRATF